MAEYFAQPNEFQIASSTWFQGKYHCGNVQLSFEKVVLKRFSDHKNVLKRDWQTLCLKLKIRTICNQCKSNPGFFCVHDDSHAGISKKSVFIYQNWKNTGQSQLLICRLCSVFSLIQAWNETFFRVSFADVSIIFMIWDLVFYLFCSYGKMYSVLVGFHACRFVVRNRPCLRTVN